MDWPQFCRWKAAGLSCGFPCCWGLGIWIYFAQAQEPDVRTGQIWIPFLLVLIAAGRLGLWFRLPVIASLAVSLGYGLALWSAHRADVPQIRYPVGETVEGRVLEVSRSASGAPRLLLDRLMIYGIERNKTPERVRLTVLGGAHHDMPAPGARIRTYATLMPNGEPVEPGAFDFRRRAFFERLGGVGLVRGAVLLVPGDAHGGVWDRPFVWLQRQRYRISRALREALHGRQGAFAAAIVVGDRSGIEEADAEALRASNLAHLLAISGLHMGILTGLIFALSRLILALSPAISLNFSTKKLAAVIALFAGAGYLALSGATIATQRAFIMVAVAFTAVLLDRPALTLRALALAAAIVLALRPISLLDAGFQMSFAATAALVSGFEYLRTRRQFEERPKSRGWVFRGLSIVAIYVGGVIVSSLLAGIATAPIAAYHFNRTAPYGLLSNLLALPVMGFVIAPSACLAAVLAPLGLEHAALAVMGQGIEQVLRTAHWVSNLPGAVRMIPEAPGPVLALVALGGLWMFVWRGAWRLAGLVPLAVALLLWTRPADRPDILIAPGARLIGVMGQDGRILDHPTAQGFAAKSWLRRDGDAADQAEASERPGLERGNGTFRTEAGGWSVRVVWNKGLEGTSLSELCTDRSILIAKHGSPVEGQCLYLGKWELARSGAVSISIVEDRPQVRRARDPSRQRLWSRQ